MWNGDRPISQELQRRGVPSPAPLRSADYPLGIPGISGINKVKVEKANELYRFTLCMLVFLDKRVAVSIENPFGSYLWAALVKLTMEHSKQAMALYNRLEMVRFHSCCHGSKRRKDTGWLSTPGVFKPLYAVCANDHTHEPWGVSWSPRRGHCCLIWHCSLIGHCIVNFCAFVDVPWKGSINARLVIKIVAMTLHRPKTCVDIMDFEHGLRCSFTIYVYGMRGWSKIGCPCHAQA